MAGNVQTVAPTAATPAAPAPPTRFRMTTWNVENLFDEYNDPLKDEPVPSKSAVDKKLAAIAKVVKTLAPDVLAVQEVESIGILQRLAKATWPNSTMNSVLVEGFDPRGIDVGLITRFPVVKTVSHAEEKLYPPDDPRTYYRYARDCLEVHLDVDGWPVVVLVTHQISRGSSPATTRAAGRSRCAPGRSPTGCAGRIRTGR